MAKAGKRKVPLAAAKPPAKNKDNPFDTLNKAKRRFNTVGRNLGPVKSVLAARNDAADRRKSTLLVEYKQLKKANAFVDRRFGEYDDKLTEEEKAIARFQKERLKKARKQKFTLSEEVEAEAEPLTHMGAPLAALDDFKAAVPDGAGSDGDEGDQLGSDFVSRFHFGGGADGGSGGGAEGGARKSKRDVMAEVMARSKLAKAEKRQQKEEDEDELSRLDERFAALQRGNRLARVHMAAGESKTLGEDAPSSEVDAAYDKQRRLMAFDARGKAGDRQQTEEELLEQEQARLRRLEAQRQRRERGGGDGGDSSEDEGDGAGGYKARRAKARREEAADARGDAAKSAARDGAEAEDDFAATSSSNDGDQDASGAEADAGASALDARRAARAAGAHPLQQSMRATTAQTLLKHGVQPTRQSLADLEAAQASSSAESDDGTASDADTDSASGSDATPAPAADAAGPSGAQPAGEATSSDEDGSVDSAEAAAIEAQLEAAERQASSRAKGSSGRGSDGSDDGSSSDGSGDAVLDMLQKAIAIKRQQEQPGAAERPIGSEARDAASALADSGAGSASASEAGGSSTLDGISFTPELPDSYAELAAMTAGLSGLQTVTLLQRMRAYHATALTSSDSIGLQKLYALVMQHYAEVAGGVPVRRDVLDALTPLLVTMTAEVPLYAATLARSRLAAMHRRFKEALADPTRERSGWPGNRGILLLRLFLVLFPASDRRHAVCTPLALLLGYLLSSCPLRQPRDIATALLLAGILQGMAAEGKRYAPEVTPLCEALLRSAAHEASRADEDRLLCGHFQLPHGALAHGSASARKRERSGEATPSDGLPVWRVLGEDADSPYFASGAFREAAFITTIRLVEGQLAAVQACAPASVPPAVLPLQRALHPGTIDLSASSADSAAVAARALDAASAASVQERKPLVCAALMKKAPRKLLNPKFELGFAKQKDFDPDRERADFKQYKRMAAKEQRALKREVTRDAAFMGEVRRQEKVRAANVRDKTQKRAIAFLEQQESDFKSGGQGGMNPHLKKRKKAA